MIEINRNPTAQQARLFALLWLPALGALVGALAYFRFHQETVALWIWGSFAAITAAAIFSPALRRGSFVALQVITYPLGFVISHLLLGVIFFVIIAPLGLLVRLVGKDLLQRKLDPNAGSYWVDRGAPPKPGRYLRQF